MQLKFDKKLLQEFRKFVKDTEYEDVSQEALDAADAYITMSNEVIIALIELYGEVIELLPANEAEEYTAKIISLVAQKTTATPEDANKIIAMFYTAPESEVLKIFED